SAVLADGPLLHATAVAAATPSGANTMACNCGAFYVRIRMTASGLDKLDVQKISDPSASSQWTTWTNLVASNVAHARGIAIFWTGTYCVVCWQDLASGDVKFKRSTDGAAWSATATAYATTGNTKVLSGCSAGGSTSGLALAYASQVYWGQYNDAANTWAAVSSAGATLTSATPDLAVFADTANSRYIFAVATAGFKTWTTFALALFTRSFAGAWDSGRVLFAQSSTGFSGLSFAQTQVRGRWWLSFYKLTLWSVTPFTSQLICSSDDGLYWSDPLPTALAGNERTLDILSAASGWSSAYLSTERAAYRLDTYAYWSAAVVRYEWAAATLAPASAGVAGSQAAGGGDEPRSQLRVVLDNRAGALTRPRLFSELTLSRGYVVSGVNTTQSAGRWYVAGFRYAQNDELLELECFDARGLLATWFAAEAANYRLDTVATLVERICALAGVHSVSFDSFAAWGDVVTAFTHPLGENALYSLRSLAERVPFEYLVKEDGSLYFYVPSTGPASVYTYGSGAGAHPF
ncbi:MAG: hypothetical protein ABI847_21195, partial [Anaerolineales bacterium]